MKSAILAVPLVAAFDLPAFAKDVPATAHPPSAATFADKSAITDRYEIQAGQLAQKKSSDGKVDTYAKMIVQDHQKALDQLNSAAASLKNVALPGGLDEPHASMLQQLKGLSGKEFERVFKLQQVEGHKQAILLTKAYAQAGDNDQLKKLAQASLPVLKTHLAHAQELPPSAGGE